MGGTTYHHDIDSLLSPVNDVPPYVSPCIEDRRRSASRRRRVSTACFIVDPVSQLGTVWIVQYTRGLIEEHTEVGHVCVNVS